MSDDEVRYLRELELNVRRGNSDALVDLGALYLNGARGVPQDTNIAHKLFRKALRRGNERAYYYLEFTAPRNSIAKWIWMIVG